MSLAFDLTDGDRLLIESPLAPSPSPSISLPVSLRGVVFFQKQDDIVPEDIGRLALRLGELAGKPEDSTLHIHPTQELSENGLPLGKISSTPDRDGRQISFAEKGLTSAGWHSDVCEWSQSSSLVSHSNLQGKLPSVQPLSPAPRCTPSSRCTPSPASGGDTLWSSNYAAYDRLTPAYQRFLEGLTALHDAERFRVQARRNGFKLRTEPRGSPHNAGDAFQANHPVIRCVSLSVTLAFVLHS